MNIFHIVSYKSLGFGALILGIKLLLIIKTFLQMLYISTFSIFLVCIILKYRWRDVKNNSLYFNMTIKYLFWLNVNI